MLKAHQEDQPSGSSRIWVCWAFTKAPVRACFATVCLSSLSTSLASFYLAHQSNNHPQQPLSQQSTSPPTPTSNATYLVNPLPKDSASSNSSPPAPSLACQPPISPLLSTWSRRGSKWKPERATLPTHPSDNAQRKCTGKKGSAPSSKAAPPASSAPLLNSVSRSRHTRCCRNCSRCLDPSGRKRSRRQV